MADHLHRTTIELPNNSLGVVFFFGRVFAGFLNVLVRGRHVELICMKFHKFFRLGVKTIFLWIEF